MSVSLFPEDVEILRQREKEFDLPRSILLQALVEIEQRDSLVRRELIARLTPKEGWAAAQQQERNHDSTPA